MTNDALDKALAALDLLRLRAYSHAEKSNGPKEMREWIDSDVEKIKAVIYRAALAQQTEPIEKMINGIQQFERVVCEDCPYTHGTVISCTKDLVVVKWDDGKTGKLIWNKEVLYNAYRLQPVRKAALAPVDLEGLKNEVVAHFARHRPPFMHTKKMAVMIPTIIDHLAARGCFGVPEGYALVPIECLEYLSDESKFDNTVTSYVTAMLSAAPKKEGNNE